jgi:hypothetical protein
MYLQVEDPPEIESMDDEVLLNAWRDKTMAEINELVRCLVWWWEWRTCLFISPPGQLLRMLRAAL